MITFTTTISVHQDHIEEALENMGTATLSNLAGACPVYLAIKEAVGGPAVKVTLGVSNVILYNVDPRINPRSWAAELPEDAICAADTFEAGYSIHPRAFTLTFLAAD